MRNLYALHSVLVHSGGVHGGHYYAFIRPDGKRWLKFDDERVRAIACSGPPLRQWSEQCARTPLYIRTRACDVSAVPDSHKGKSRCRGSQAAAWSMRPDKTLGAVHGRLDSAAHDQ